MARSENINVRVEKEAKETFKEACANNFTDPSAELYKFIHQYNKRNQGKKVLLSELKHKH